LILRGAITVCGKYGGKCHPELVEGQYELKNENILCLYS